MSDTTTKADLADAVYSQVGGFSKRESAEIVDSAFQIVKDALGRGEKVKVSGFGNFVVRDKDARPGRNPVTGEKIIIEARRVATFRASPVLKKHVNDALSDD